MYLDLPNGTKWFLKGVNLSSLRVYLAPLGKCWYIYIYIKYLYIYIYNQLRLVVNIP